VWFAGHLPFVPVIGDGSQQMQPVFIDDVAEAMARAADPGGPVGTFELGGPEVMTMNDLLATMIDVVGRRRPLVHFPAALPKLAGFFLQVLPKPPLSPAAVDFVTDDAVADTRSLVASFGLRPTALREGLETYLRP
jgi:NADH dehydrogenase